MRLALDDAEQAEGNYREALQLAVDIYAPIRIVQALLGIAALRKKAAHKEAALALADLIWQHPE